MMGSWLRNIQGQLSEFASEVLNEATEEVSDPESELQVARKKLLETEKELSTEKENVQRLKKKIDNLEEELYAKNLELDNINGKYTSVIESRDTQIRALQAELERTHHVVQESLSDGDEDGFFPANNARVARMRDEIDQLRKEAAHWKRLVNEQSEKSEALKVSELERILAEQKTKFENEVAALIMAHNETVAELKSLNQEDRNPNKKDESSGCYTEQYISENDTWKEQIHLLTEERDLLLAKIKSIEEENEIQEDQVDKLTFQAVDIVLSERLNELEQQRESLEKQLHAAQGEIIEKSSYISQLQTEVREVHHLVDTQREKFENEISGEREQSRAEIEELQNEVANLQLLLNSYEENKNSEESKTVENIEKLDEVMGAEVSESTSKDQAELDRELEKLRRENDELAAAYNDLNEDFENHKAKHGSVVSSNRDLTARIDCLRASLIEYEERYEMCKNENDETIRQLQRLSNDFERLRLSFESPKTKNTSDTVDEVERLRTELDASKDDGEKLRTEVERFRSAIAIIDKELTRLRESNDRLIQENKAMGDSLDKFSEIQNMLENSNSELKNLREKFIQLQNEYELKEKQWREQQLELCEARDDAKRRLEAYQRETAMQQSRSSDIALSAEIVELKNDEGKVTTSSEGTVDSNNGWEKMADWDAIASTNGSSLANNCTVMNELREALAVVTEKTEECEELRRQKHELNKELDLRQTRIDELMVQLNVLQSQQTTHAETFAELRSWANELERDKLELERSLVHTKEKLDEVQKQQQLDAVKGEELVIVKQVDLVQQMVNEYEQKMRNQNAIHEETLRNTKAEHRNDLEELTNKLKAAQDEIKQLQQQNKAEERYEPEAEEKFLRLKTELMEAVQKRNELEKTNSELQHKLDETSVQVTEAEKLRIELIALVEQKHNESLKYHTQLQAALAEKKSQSATFATYTDNLSILKNELKNCMETRDKALRECERLRNHLLVMEETSTKEALAGEERETELRQRIRILEQKTEESADSVIESANAYERQITELTDELDLMRNEKISIVDRLREREKTLADTKVALSNLQNVLRDIGVDHEAQVLQYENTIAELKKSMENLNLEIVQFKRTQETIEAEKQLLENRTVYLKEEIIKKNAMIEELEASLEEHAQVAVASVSSYTIDDQVLRQLFMSYFTADKDKQPEIAVLLASVLGYSQEEIAKINAANHSSSRGWFGFGGSSKLPQQNISLAEQFVRFLEKESLITPHSLPVQPSEEKETIRSSIPLKCSRTSSAADLNSILNT
ncbi:Uncharacterized protein BM_BM7286 [Brugia malayi]|uniref:Viral A-type inclusion protein repeat containing protein n=3 Tax=Brugia malayi TaxID=6279 RepID=A0A4E9FC26_BRUMA|nr:Uncharacterized protein BM_BM7286 [Brugia malayi]VIO92288.1 Uncharacterized protein BM_BM7286 [Brugia malayi]